MTDAAKAQDDKQQIKSKKRVADFGEVFTAEREVHAMLDFAKSTKAKNPPNMPNFIMKNTPFVPYHQFMALSFWRIIVMSAVADCWIYS